MERALETILAGDLVSLKRTLLYLLAALALVATVAPRTV